MQLWSQHEKITCCMRGSACGVLLKIVKYFEVMRNILPRVKNSRILMRKSFHESPDNVSCVGL